MRVLALARFRLAGALTARTLLGPLVGLLAVEVLGLAGPAAPAAVLLVTAVAFALPLLAWVVRQVLDSSPDEQARLSALAVDGPVRAVLAGQLAAYAVVAPLGLLCAAAALLRVDEAGVPVGDLAAGTGLALSGALVAVAVGSLASRAVADASGASALVLVAVPVLVAVLGLSGSPWVTALVPRVDAAARAAYDGRLAASAPGLVAQTAVWGLVVLALRTRLVRRG